jgi:hypothetical protein
MQDPLIHIGYHKTGSSWLQQLFFPGHPQLAGIADQGAIWSRLIEPHDLDFEAAACRAAFQNDLEAALAAGRIPVVSSERLSGNPHSGGYDSGRIAERVAAVFPGARILIVVRRQPDMLSSLYRQYVRAGGICTLAEYLDPVRDGRMPLFRPNHLCYDRLVARYRALQGAERVLVLPYELLAADWRRFLGELCEFLCIPRYESAALERRVEPSWGDVAVALKRRVNRWHGADSLYPVTPRWPRVTGALFTDIRRLDQVAWLRGLDLGYRRRCADFATGRYEDSNRRLQELTGLSLSEHGYPLA